MPYTIELTDSFSAAHYLPHHPGKCREIHGHRWVVTIEITVDHIDDHPDGMVVDFGYLKDIIRRYDHPGKPLNEFISNPTAENIAERITHRVAYLMLRRFDTLSIRVTVEESPGCRVTVERWYIEGELRGAK